MLGRYRRTGADLPFTDPRRAHGVAFEGWYWRLTQPRTGHVLVVLVGINQAADGTWATVGLAAHPGHHHQAIAVQQASVSADGRTIRAGDILAVDDTRVRIALGDSRIEFTLDEPTPWPRRGLGGIGLAQAIPGLSQYWHPYLLHARAHGTARIDGDEIPIEGAHAYAEKNWGSGGFPRRWWWGQAHAFEGRDDVTVAFAGGTAGLGPLTTTATSLVVHAGATTHRVVRPLQRLRVEVTPERWLIRGGGIELEGHADGAPAYVLPVPLPRERRNLQDAASQHLAGTIRLELPDGWEGVSRLAGLEQGSARPGA